MPMTLEELLQYLTVPLAALVVLGIVVVRGLLTSAALAAGPDRSANITLLDLFVGIWLLLVASALLLVPVLRWLTLPLPGGTPPPTARQIALIALIGQAVTQLPVVLLAVYKAVQTPIGLRELGVIPRRPLTELKAGGLSLLVAMPLVLGSSAIFMLLSRLLDVDIPAVAHDLLRELLSTDDSLAVTLMVASAVVVAPVLEEVIFRGLVQTALLSWLGPSRRWAVVLIAALLFAVIHADVATWHVLPGLFILGVILGWLYERHGSLLPGIVLHVLFNASNILLGLLQSESL